MNDSQKSKITEMRLQGLGYKAIAKELSLTRDSVKGYCKRNLLSGIGATVNQNLKVMNVKTEICSCCNKPIKQIPRGRNRRFCSDGCRRKWWNENPDKRTKNENAMYKYNCIYCNKEFVCYGNKKRKFCSHNCYIKSRFWKEEENGV